MNEATLKVTPIESKQPTAPAKFIVGVVLEGFPIQVEVEGKASDLRALVDRLKAIGAEPPQSSRAATIEPTKKSAPVCPVHNTPMKPSRKPGHFYCAKRADDGEYCRETA